MFFIACVIVCVRTGLVYRAFPSYNGIDDDYVVQRGILDDWEPVYDNSSEEFQRAFDYHIESDMTSDAFASLRIYKNASTAVALVMFPLLFYRRNNNTSTLLYEHLRDAIAGSKDVVYDVQLQCDANNTGQHFMLHAVYPDSSYYLHGVATGFILHANASAVLSFDIGDPDIANVFCTPPLYAQCNYSTQTHRRTVHALPGHACVDNEWLQVTMIYRTTAVLTGTVRIRVVTRVDGIPFIDTTFAYNATYHRDSSQFVGSGFVFNSFISATIANLQIDRPGSMNLTVSPTPSPTSEPTPIPTSYPTTSAPSAEPTPIPPTYEPTPSPPSQSSSTTLPLLIITTTTNNVLPEITTPTHVYTIIALVAIICVVLCLVASAYMASVLRRGRRRQLPLSPQISLQKRHSTTDNYTSFSDAANLHDTPVNDAYDSASEHIEHAQRHIYTAHTTQLDNDDTQRYDLLSLSPDGDAYHETTFGNDTTTTSHRRSHHRRPLVTSSYNETSLSSQYTIIDTASANHVYDPVSMPLQQQAQNRRQYDDTSSALSV